MNTRFFYLFALVCVLVLPLSGCDSNDDHEDIVYGAAASVGDGTARTYVQMKADGTPSGVGVLLSAAALDGLPDGSNSGHDHELMTVLPIPAEARAAGVPFDHVSLDWNPHGHEPEGLFTIPHFDMHFYMVTEATRMTWTPDNPQFAQKSMQTPAAKYVPQGYALVPGSAAVPMMGLHWVDPSDPTYASGGPPFTEVFIWGSYDGQMVFAEPMITRAFLKELPTNGGRYEEMLAQPQAFAKTGFYPTRYTIDFDAERKEYRIALSDLMRRTADE